MYFVVYRTTNLVNGKFYIGAHKTNDLEDGYIGSGKHFLNAVTKYGKIHFKREILQFCDSEKEMYEIESQLIELSEQSYNIHSGGKGGWNEVPNGNKGLMWINDGNQNRKIPKDDPVPKGWYKGVSQKTKDKNAESLKGKKKITEEGRERLRKYIRENNPSKRKEVREKIRNTLKGRVWVNNGIKSKQVELNKIPTGWVRGRGKGRVWVNNGIKSKQVELNKIPTGWVRGRGLVRKNKVF